MYLDNGMGSNTSKTLRRASFPACMNEQPSVGLGLPRAMKGTAGSRRLDAFEGVGEGRLDGSTAFCSHRRPLISAVYALFKYSLIERIFVRLRTAVPENEMEVSHNCERVRRPQTIKPRRR